MPISGALLGQQILDQMHLNGMPGTGYTTLFTNAIGNGIANGLLTAAYLGTSMGVGVGAGVSTGAITGPAIIPTALSAFMLTEMLTPQPGCPPEHNNMPGGPSAVPFRNALATAIALHIQGVIISGSSTIVATGAGSGSIIGITGPSLSSLIQAELAGVNMSGAAGYPKISTVIGNAVANALLASVVTTVIVGSPIGTPVPGSVGVDSGSLT